VQYFDYRRAREVKYGADISHKQLAENAGISSVTVVNYLSGKTRPSFDFVVTLSRMSGYPVTEFISE
jgi:transcriptional regulator with XRE-family HTH domain